MRCFLRLSTSAAKSRAVACALAVSCLCAVQVWGVGASASKPHAAIHSSHPVLVGYFPQWGLYAPQPFYVKALVTSGSAARLDQINYAQGYVTNGRCSLSDANASLNTTYTKENSVNGLADLPASPFRGYFHQLQELKRRYPKLKILISLEGRPSDFAEDAKPENRVAFVASCIDLYVRGEFVPGVRKRGIFDGFDIDWESPQEADAANFQGLLEEFRRQMKAVRPGLRLSVAVGQSPGMLPGTDFAALGEIVDQVGIMNYDYAGPWSKTTGFLAPLFAGGPTGSPVSAAHGWGRAGSIERSIAGYKEAGIPEEKLLMGLPFYGYGWTGVSAENNGLFQAGRGMRTDKPYRALRDLAENRLIGTTTDATESAVGVAGSAGAAIATAPSIGTASTETASTGTAITGSASNGTGSNELASTERAPFQVYRDERSQAPWLFDGQTFWTFEDPVSVRYKASYAVAQHLGGMMIWELSGDTPDAELLNVAYRSLRRPLDPSVFAAAVAARVLPLSVPEPAPLPVSANMRSPSAPAESGAAVMIVPAN